MEAREFRLGMGIASREIIYQLIHRVTRRDKNVILSGRLHEAN